MAKKITPALKRDIIRLYKKDEDIKDIVVYCRAKFPKITSQRVATVLHSHFEGRADDLWALKVKEKFDYKCAISGKNNVELNSHHLIGRNNSNYRFDVDNGVCLSAYHHTLSPAIAAHGSTDVTDRFIEWLQETRPEQYEWFCENRDNKAIRPYRFWELEIIVNELKDMKF